MKEAILATIYSRFADWTSEMQFICGAGCATCCTTNVTVTALEGRRILKYCHQRNKLTWLLELLTRQHPLEAPQQTPNEFVAAVLNEQTVKPPSRYSGERCLFLDNDICTIYPIRPFSCRCFASTTLCSEHDVATVTDSYLYGSTAAMQIIEHLGQFDSWGYMSDILLQQADTVKYPEIIDFPKIPEQLEQSLSRLRTAQPIPGFILPEDDESDVALLLESIFSCRIDTRTIEQILNGHQP